MKKSKRLIYALKCPFTEEVHYIGKTTYGMLKPMQDLNSTHSAKIKEWVENLKKLGHAPKVQVVEYLKEEDDIDMKEQFWIQKQIKAGSDLLNSVLVQPVLLDKSLQEYLNPKDYEDFHQIAEFLKRKRKQIGLTQEEMASKAGISLKVLRKIEQKKSNYEISGLLKVLSMFGCTLAVEKINHKQKDEGND